VSHQIRRLGEVVAVVGGGTPSTKQPAYWAGDIPWVSPKDMKSDEVGDSIDKISAQAIEDSAATLIPSGAVLVVVRSGILAHTVPVALATRPLTVNQDLKALCPSPVLEPRYLYYFMRAAQPELLRKVTRSATVHRLSTASLTSLEMPVPPIAEQRYVVATLDEAFGAIGTVTANVERNLARLRELRLAILANSFQANRPQFVTAVTSMTPIELHAGILAIAYQHHVNRGREATFQHVKAEKIAHMVETCAGLDLGRTPIKDAAGPNDFPHLHRVQHRAEKANYFAFKRRERGYQFSKKNNFERLVSRATNALGVNMSVVEKVIDAMVPMDSKQAEIFATTFAAWNNILLDGGTPSDEAIVRAARDDWHPDKTKIDEGRFYEAIKWMREHNFVPHGTGKRVLARPL
jgi:Type I restriction modification DNA specificity domain